MDNPIVVSFVFDVRLDGMTGEQAAVAAFRVMIATGLGRLQDALPTLGAIAAVREITPDDIEPLIDGAFGHYLRVLPAGGQFRLELERFIADHRSSMFEQAEAAIR